MVNNEICTLEEFFVDLWKMCATVLCRRKSTLGNLFVRREILPRTLFFPNQSCTQLHETNRFGTLPIQYNRSKATRIVLPQSKRAFREGPQNTLNIRTKFDWFPLTSNCCKILPRTRFSKLCFCTVRRQRSPNHHYL